MVYFQALTKLLGYFFFAYRTDLRDMSVVVLLSTEHLGDYKCLLIDHAHVPSSNAPTLKKKNT